MELPIATQGLVHNHMPERNFFALLSRIYGDVVTSFTLNPLVSSNEASSTVLVYTSSLLAVLP